MRPAFPQWAARVPPEATEFPTPTVAVPRCPGGGKPPMLLLLPLPSLLLRLQPQLLYTGPARLCATGPRMHRRRR